MPAIPPNALVAGQQYVSIRRNNPRHLNGFGHPRTFQGINPEGFARFNAGHGASASSNPAVFNFYSPNDPFLQNVHGAQEVNSVGGPGAGSNVGAPGAGAKGAAQGGRRKTRKSKSRKSLKKRSTRKH